MTAEPPAEQLTPAELALRGRLATLREVHPDVPAAMPRDVVRTARWQRAVWSPVRVGALIAAAAAYAVRLLVGARPGGDR